MRVLFTSESGKPLIFNPDDRDVQTWTLFPKGGDHGEMLSRLRDRRCVLWRSVAPDRIGVDPMDEGRLVSPEEALRLLSRWHHELPVDLISGFEVASIPDGPRYGSEVDVFDPDTGEHESVDLTRAKRLWSAYRSPLEDDFDVGVSIRPHEEHLYDLGWGDFVLKLVRDPVGDLTEFRYLDEGESVCWFFSRKVKPPAEYEDLVRKMEGTDDINTFAFDWEIAESVAASDWFNGFDGSIFPSRNTADGKPIESFESLGPGPDGEVCDAARGDKPRWDADNRILYYGDKVARAFQRRAESCVKILLSFEEVGWERRADSLFAESDMKDGKHHDALRSLNTGLRFIRFGSDGTGEGFIWEPITPKV
jgi:hypothetical protein